MKKAFKENWPLYFIFLAIIIVVSRDIVSADDQPSMHKIVRHQPDHWIAPSLYINSTEGFDRQQIIYGQELIANTSRYFGPNGTVAKITNGMNCQNCHLDAGTRAWGSNFGAVLSTYPRFSNRTGKMQTIAGRITDCFERSLDGTAPDTSGKEMQAMIAYISWLGTNVPHGVRPRGCGIEEIAYIDRAADPKKGELLYEAKCKSCHGSNGAGVSNPDNSGFVYPPLWGAGSYNNGAGLYRLSRFAGFIKDNMPFDLSSHKSPELTDAEAWDIAAYVNSKPRPHKDISHDWPDLSKKPVDHPFGPYSDGFSEEQHKYGPWGVIVSARRGVKN